MDYCDPPDDDTETLVHLLDRVLDTGIVATGDLTLTVADVDLVYIGLNLVVASVDRIDPDGTIRQSFFARRALS